MLAVAHDLERKELFFDVSLVDAPARVGYSIREKVIILWIWRAVCVSLS